MTRTTVKSSNINAVGYDPLTEELSVEFKNGSIYNYAGVHHGAHAALMAAPSIGKFLNENIKGKHNYSQETSTPTPAAKSPATDGWILTKTGIRFELFDPTPEMVNIEDIAHALAHICRFGGHTPSFYSVAQHSVIVSQNVPDADALTALMHDATEAYVGDMVRPLKRSLPECDAVEDRIWEVIRSRFALGPMTAAIKSADESALQTERRDLLLPSGHAWTNDEQRAKPFSQVIRPWDSYMAKGIFLDHFKNLGGVA